MRYVSSGGGGSLIVCGLLLLGLLSMSLTPPLMRQGTSRTKLDRRLYITGERPPTRSRTSVVVM